MIILLICKCVFLFLAIWALGVNILRAIAGQSVSALNLMLQAIGITGFVVFQWLV